MKNLLAPSSSVAAVPHAQPAGDAAGPRWQAVALYAGTLAFALLGLTACADMSGIAPRSQMRDAASLGLAAHAEGVADAARAFADPAVASDWWRGFGDAQLDALIEQALSQSPDLKLAEARIARAQAFTEGTRAADRPQVNGSLDATRQRYSSNSIYPPPLGGSTKNSATGRLTGSWELDFFGKNRAAIDAAVGSANAAIADAQAARVLLASNVVRQYVELARVEAQLGVAQRTLEQRTQTLALVRDRVAAGLDTRLEERQSEGSLPEARQQIEALREQAAMARNALDALVGQPGAAQALVPPPLSSLHAIALPAALPADLLGRRADIAAARWRVEAATQDVAMAKAQFYPNVSLTAFVGLASLGLDNFVKGGSREWGVGPAIRLPIFEAGRLRANLRGKAADVDAAVESYNATLLDALHEAAGQSATLTADLYGSKVEYTGKVVGLGVGTGAAFALLPAQNATGNWIKVVQRVPVRIALDAEQLKGHPLRVGLSMDVTVNTQDRTGALLADAPRAEAVAQTAVYAGLDRGADEEVARIVAANAGPAPRAGSRTQAH